MPADAWIALLADPGSWREQWGGLEPHDWLGWESPKPYLSLIEKGREQGFNESVRVGTCRLAGHRVWLAVFEFGFLGGSLGVVSGERLARSMEAAVESSRPFVLVTSSGGARMQEGILALMQMAKVNAAVDRLQAARVPYFSVLTDPTFGGTAASLALLADVNIGEPSAAIGFTGPRVIEHATYSVLPVGFQSAEFQLTHGQLDMVTPRPRLRATLAHLLQLYS